MNEPRYLSTAWHLQQARRLAQIERRRDPGFIPTNPVRCETAWAFQEWHRDGHPKLREAMGRLHAIWRAARRLARERASARCREGEITVEFRAGPSE